MLCGCGLCKSALVGVSWSGKSALWMFRIVVLVKAGALCSLVVFPPLSAVEVEPVVRVAAAHGNAILSQTQYWQNCEQITSIVKSSLPLDSSSFIYHIGHHLISAVVWFALPPLGECERVPVGPLEGSLLWRTSLPWWRACWWWSLRGALFLDLFYRCCWQWWWWWCWQWQWGWRWHWWWLSSP